MIGIVTRNAQGESRIVIEATETEHLWFTDGLNAILEAYEQEFKLMEPDDENWEEEHKLYEEVTKLRDEMVRTFNINA